MKRLTRVQLAQPSVTVCPSCGRDMWEGYTCICHGYPRPDKQEQEAEKGATDGK